MKHPKKRRRHSTTNASRTREFSPTRLRIVAGTYGGRKIEYNGDPLTRPMKERTREAVFSLLGGYLQHTWCVDLFAGTGILALESISRGSEHAVILELARPAINTILGNARSLDMTDLIEVQNVDTLRWFRSIENNIENWRDLPWVVFCCPPYQMWSDDSERLTAGIAQMFELSPPGSKFVCETDQNFNLAGALPQIEWDVRNYPPATISVAEKASTSRDQVNDK